LQKAKKIYLKRLRLFIYKIFKRSPLVIKSERNDDVAILSKMVM
jgi:hypothetical protein